MNNSGKFIVVEGLDGSGKTTLCEGIAAALRRENLKVFETCEPTHFKAGDYARTILSGRLKKDPYMLSALFLADRIEHITHPTMGIKKVLDDGQIVVCDRYYYSSIAYQGLTDIDWTMDINLNCPRMIKPDICIFIDTPPKVCRDRIVNARDKVELYEENLDTLTKIRENFLYAFDKLKVTDNIFVIPAEAEGRGEVVKYAMKEIVKLLSQGIQ